MHGKGGGVRSRGGVRAGATATETGGTHPTGMYPCYDLIFQPSCGSGVVFFSDQWFIISAFLRFWGIVFFISTTLVAFLKREKEDEEETEGVVDTYKLLLKIVRLPAVISLITILLTSKVIILGITCCMER